MIECVRKIRAADEMRSVEIIPDFLPNAEGSALVCFGNTKVICTASVEGTVPSFLKGRNQGWVTAEYGMLPRSTHSRMKRESAQGKQSGRTQEIQRLIGRSLRAVTDLALLGERQILIDCDVLQADGGTRTASITGAFVALGLAVRKLLNDGVLQESPIKEAVAAVSVGIYQGHALLDLDYQEDSQCDVDMNIVMTSGGRLVEIQGTAEQEAFSRAELNCLLDLGEKGIRKLISIQNHIVNR